MITKIQLSTEAMNNCTFVPNTFINKGKSSDGKDFYALHFKALTISPMGIETKAVSIFFKNEEHAALWLECFVNNNQIDSSLFDVITIEYTASNIKDVVSEYCNISDEVSFAVKNNVRISVSNMKQNPTNKEVLCVNNDPIFRTTIMVPKGLAKGKSVVHTGSISMTTEAMQKYVETYRDAQKATKTQVDAEAMSMLLGG